MTASAAARRMSSGPGSSGKPWPRLMALLSRASCDIASKTVTGRSPKTLFREADVMESSAARPGRQSSGLPAQNPPREMLVVSKARGLRGQRRRHRTLAGTAGEHDLLAMGVGNILRIKGGKRNHDAIRIGLDRDF